MNWLSDPQVLECMLFVAASDSEGSRIVKHYEFDLYMGGSREITIDGASFSIGRGSLVFRKPGQFAVGRGDYNMYSMTLNFSEEYKGQDQLFRGKDGEIQPLCPAEELQNLPTVFCPEHFDDLVYLYQGLSECSYPNLADEARQRAYIHEFLLLVLYDAARYRRQARQTDTVRNTYVKQACNYIHTHFAEPITVNGVAAELSVDPNYLIRLFKAELQTTPGKYLLETRLFRARLMLVQTDQSVKEIAIACGFGVPSYFTKRFSERFGQTPLHFRRHTQ